MFPVADKGIGTYRYKTYLYLRILILMTWGRVNSVVWPYKAMERCSNALYSESTGGSMLIISRSSYITPLSVNHFRFWPNKRITLNCVIRGHVRSNAFLPLTFDRKDIHRALGTVSMCIPRRVTSTTTKHDLLGSPRIFTWPRSEINIWPWLL